MSCMPLSFVRTAMSGAASMPPTRLTVVVALAKKPVLPLAHNEQGDYVRLPRLVPRLRPPPV